MNTVAPTSPRTPFIHCGRRWALLFGAALLFVHAPRAEAGIVGLQPSPGNTTQIYQHTYTAGVISTDSNAMLHLVTPVTTTTPQSFFYQVNTGNAQGSVIFNFEFAPPPDLPNAVIQSISVTSHSNDFDGGPGFAQGTFWTDRMTTPVEFFNTTTDGNAIVTRSLGDFAAVGGARSVQLIYTANLNGGTNNTQQLLGAHAGTSIPSWTFDVTATWADSPSPFTPITVLNPSFELENVGDANWAPSSTPLHNASWSYAAGDFRVHDPNSVRFPGTGGNSLNTQNILPHGGQILNMSSALTSQNVGSIDPLTEYMLSFWIGTAADAPFNVPGTFEAVLMDDGVPFATLAAGAPLPGTFKQFSLLAETAAGVSGTLSIGFRTTGGTVWLDDVELFSRAVQVEAIPEPAALFAWLIAGAAAVAVAARFPKTVGFRA